MPKAVIDYMLTSDYTAYPIYGEGKIKVEIFSGNGVSLHKRGDKYYIRYLVDETESWIVEIEITSEDAMAVQVSQDMANRIISKYRNKCIAETGYSWKSSDFISVDEMRKEGYNVPDEAQPPQFNVCPPMSTYPGICPPFIADLIKEVNKKRQTGQSGTS